MGNVKQLSATEAAHKIDVVSGVELEKKGAPPIEQRKARMRPHLAMVGDDVGVINPETGEAREGAGGRPVTIGQLIQELCEPRDDREAQLFRWKVYGRPI